MPDIIKLLDVSNPKSLKNILNDFNSTLSGYDDDITQLENDVDSLQSNAVLLDTNQNINSNKSIKYGKKLNFLDATNVGNAISMFVYTDDLYIQGGMYTDVLLGANLLPSSSAYHSLGTLYNKWKDLYLSGSLSDGTNSITIADITAKAEQVTANTAAIATKQDASGNTALTTADKTIVGAINEVDNLAKGRTFARTYNSISDMITALNAMSATDLKVGDNVYIVTEDVPDLWIGKVESSSSTYTYTTDSAFISALTGSLSTTVQVGYYRLLKLESEKVDLSNVVDSNSTITDSGDGNVVTGLSIDNSGNITLTKGITAASDTDVVHKTATETITGEKIINDTVISFKNSSASGSASWQLEEDIYGQLAISRTYNGTKARMAQFNGNSFLPEGNNGNLGSNSKKWQDLYLSRNLTDGTNSITIDDIANKAVLAPIYDSTATYAVGDVVIYNKQLYLCATAVSTAEDFDSTKWTEITVDSNYVDKTTAETITGQKTFLSQLRVKRPADGGGHFYVNPDGNGYNVKIGFSSGGEIMIHNGGIQPNRSLLPTGSIDLGSSSAKWQDLHLSRNLTDGTNSITIADIANKNDALIRLLTLSTTTMTDEQIATLRSYNCILANDLVLGTTSLKAGTILTIPFEYSNSLRGIAIYNNKIMTYYINLTAKQISDGAQDIVITNVASIKTGQVDFSNGATISKDSSDRININYSNSAKVKVGSAETIIANRIGADSDNAQDIGRSTVRWKDLYLAGNLTDGTNSVAIEKIATTDTAQTISGIKTFSNGLKVDNYTIDKDTFGQLQISNANTTSMQFDGDTVRSKNLVPIGNNSRDLGSSGQKWKDLYLSGNLNDGTNSISINQITPKSMVGDAYDSTSTYAVDDVVIYNNTLYKCTTAVTVAEDFDDTKWTSTTLIAYIQSLVSGAITTALNTPV